MVTALGIEAVSLARRFGSVHALKAASFVAPSGAVTALIGPNGSGKTTLMLILASLLAPDSGTVRIAGHDPAKDRAAVRAAMGWMPDVLGTWGGLTSRTGLEITGRLHGLDRSEARVRSDALLDRVGLADLADHPARVLSRGQKQRLSLARALIHEPTVLLLDEPASGLDPSARVDLRVLVRELAAEGRTVLISSHVLAELEEMADDAVYMTDGETVGAARLAEARTRLRWWRVTAVDEGELRAAFARIGFGEDQIREDHQGLLAPVRDDADAAALLRRLVDEGARVVSFAAAVGDLEHTFLDLTAEASSRTGAPSSPVEAASEAPPAASVPTPAQTLFQRPASPGANSDSASTSREDEDR